MSNHFIHPYMPNSVPEIEGEMLREIGVGVWEDKPWGELERHDAMRLIRFNHASPEFQVEGGETFAQVQARMKGAVLDIAAKHPG